MPAVSAVVCPQVSLPLCLWCEQTAYAQHLSSNSSSSCLCGPPCSGILGASSSHPLLLSASPLPPFEHPKHTQQGLEHLTRAQASAVYPCLRSVCLDIARDAAAQQASPMQFTLRGAAGPALPRLMQVAIECHNSKMLDQSE